MNESSITRAINSSWMTLIAVPIIFFATLLPADEIGDQQKSTATQPQGLIMAESGRKYIHDWTFTVLSIERDQDEKFIIKYMIKYISPETLHEIHNDQGSKRDPQYVTIKGHGQLDKMESDSKNVNLLRAIISLPVVDCLDKETFDKISNNPNNPQTSNLSFVVAEYFIPAAFLLQIEEK